MRGANMVPKRAWAIWMPAARRAFPPHRLGYRRGGPGRAAGRARWTPAFHPPDLEFAMPGHRLQPTIPDRPGLAIAAGQRRDGHPRQCGGHRRRPGGAWQDEIFRPITTAIAAELGWTAPAGAPSWWPCTALRRSWRGFSGPGATACSIWADSALSQRLLGLLRTEFGEADIGDNEPYAMDGTDYTDSFSRRSAAAWTIWRSRSARTCWPGRLARTPSSQPLRAAVARSAFDLSTDAVAFRFRGALHLTP